MLAYIVRATIDTIERRHAWNSNNHYHTGAWTNFVARYVNREASTTPDLEVGSSGPPRAKASPAFLPRYLLKHNPL